MDLHINCFYICFSKFASLISFHLYHILSKTYNFVQLKQTRIGFSVRLYVGLKTITADHYITSPMMKDGLSIYDGEPLPF